MEEKSLNDFLEVEVSGVWTCRLCLRGFYAAAFNSSIFYTDAVNSSYFLAVNSIYHSPTISLKCLYHALTRVFIQLLAHIGTVYWTSGTIDRTQSKNCEG